MGKKVLDRRKRNRKNKKDKSVENIRHKLNKRIIKVNKTLLKERKKHVHRKEDNLRSIWLSHRKFPFFFIKLILQKINNNYMLSVLY